MKSGLLAMSHSSNMSLFFFLEFFVKNLENIKHQIERSTKENIDNEKKLASEVI